MMVLALVILSIFSPAQAAPQNEVPDPMNFDLAGPLGDEKGNYEFNTLTSYEKVKGEGKFVVAPELEYTVIEGGGLEIELPFDANGLQNVKGVAQYTFGELGAEKQMVHGTYLSYCKSFDSEKINSMANYLWGHRISHRWSYLIIAGPSLNWGEKIAAKVNAVANITLAYHLAEKTSLDLEVNYTGPTEELSLLRIMPELTHEFKDDWKAEGGAGALSVEKQKLEATAALRIIKEFK